MAQELLILGALASALEDQQREEALEKESVNWSVVCPHPLCNTSLVRIKGYRCYNASPNSSIQCNKCGDRVSAKKFLFHCPKEMTLTHLNGFDYCLSCAYKQRNQNDNNNSALKSHIAEQTKTIDNLKQNMAEMERISNEEIRKLKRERDDLLKHNKDTRHDLQQEIDRLRREKLDAQREHRLLKQKLDDKLDIIAQYKGDMNVLKNKKQNRQNGNELSPTLKAMFSQQFFQDEATRNMTKKKFITALHNEILGVTFASHQTLCWMQANCRKYDVQNEDEIFSFNHYQYKYNMNDDDDKANDDDNKPVVDLNEFDVSTIQKLHKMLNMLQKKYDECNISTKKWANTINDVLYPKPKRAEKKNEINWKHWNSQQVVSWILSLDNGRFVRYGHLLQNTQLKGYNLELMEHTDLFEIGVNIVDDQRLLLAHIDRLTKRKENNALHAEFADEGNVTEI